MLGYKLAHAVERLDVGGRDITEYLARLLRGRGYVFTESGKLTYCPRIYKRHINKMCSKCGNDVMDIQSWRSFTAELEQVRKMKEEVCYVALDYVKEKERSTMFTDVEKSYQMCDGSTVCVHSERFRAPEVFFQPSLLGIKN